MTATGPWFSARHSSTCFDLATSSSGFSRCNEKRPASVPVGLTLEEPVTCSWWGLPASGPDSSAHCEIECREIMKSVAIIQSCYIPWIGFFDLINRCDEYII